MTDQTSLQELTEAEIASVTGGVAAAIATSLIRVGQVADWDGELCPRILVVPIPPRPPIDLPRLQGTLAV